jgi:hypothetical protein
MFLMQALYVDWINCTIRRNRPAIRHGNHLSFIGWGNPYGLDGANQAQSQLPAVGAEIVVYARMTDFL